MPDENDAQARDAVRWRVGERARVMVWPSRAPAAELETQELAQTLIGWLAGVEEASAVEVAGDRAFVVWIAVAPGCVADAAERQHRRGAKQFRQRAPFHAVQDDGMARRVKPCVLVVSVTRDMSGFLRNSYCS